MHPLYSHNFGNTGIAVQFYNGTSVVAGYITKQVSVNKFVVTDGTIVKTLMLAPTSAIATSLNTPAANQAYFTIPIETPATSASGATFTVHYGLDSTTTLVTPGTAYTASEVLTVTGGGGATITTATVSGPGAILTFTVSAAGTLTALPANPLAVTSSPGSGATFTGRYKVVSVTTSGGTGYAVNQRLNFIGMTAAVLPNISILTAPGGVPATFTITSAGSGITTAATSVTVGGVTDYVAKIWDTRVYTVSGAQYYWNLGTPIENSAVIPRY